MLEIPATAVGSMIVEIIAATRTISCNVTANLDSY